jgi:molecular chaperone DnaK
VLSAELAFDLYELETGVEPIGSGVLRLVTHEGNVARAILVSLGIDEELVASLARRLGSPPPLPTRPRSEVPTAADDLVEEAAQAETEQLRVQRTGVLIGIDLGTTNTCASYVVEGQPRVIPGRTGTSTIPSMITFDRDGSFHVGRRAADRHVLNPSRTVYGSKRLVGRTFRPELAAELQRHFAYELAEAEGQRFGVRIDDRVIAMDTIAARVLDEVRSTAEAHLKQPVEAAVITVPAYFSEAVRREAAQAKLTVHRIVNDPTAAAVAYGHKQAGSSRVVVWDFGGGTFDISVVDLSAGKLEVIATGGDNFVGGSDFDDLVANHLLAEFQRVEGHTLEPTPQQLARLRQAAEHAKHTLSVEDDAAIELPDFVPASMGAPRRDLRLTLTRETFDALTRPLVDRTLAIATEVLETRGISPKAVDDVVLVGGTTRTPAVQRAVAELFGRRPSKRINPDEAVAHGAALLADEVGKTPTLLDILPMSVGRGGPRRRFEPIVERRVRLPARREIILDADVLGTVQVPLFQGESGDVGQCEYLCTVYVEDRALWDRGRVKLALAFDEHCRMSVEARELAAGCRSSCVSIVRARSRRCSATSGSSTGPPSRRGSYRRRRSGESLVGSHVSSADGRDS